MCHHASVAAWHMLRFLEWAKSPLSVMRKISDTESITASRGDCKEGAEGTCGKAARRDMGGAASDGAVIIDIECPQRVLPPLAGERIMTFMWCVLSKVWAPPPPSPLTLSPPPSPPPTAEDPERGKDIDLVINQCKDLNGNPINFEEKRAEGEEAPFLKGARLEGAEFPFGAHLEGSILNGAHLEGSLLNGAHLEGSLISTEPIWKAQFSEEPIWKTQISNEPIWKAHVSTKPIWKAHIST